MTKAYILGRNLGQAEIFAGYSSAKLQLAEDQLAQLNNTGMNYTIKTIELNKVLMSPYKFKCIKKGDGGYLVTILPNSTSIYFEKYVTREAGVEYIAIGTTEQDSVDNCTSLYNKLNP